MSSGQIRSGHCFRVGDYHRGIALATARPERQIELKIPDKRGNQTSVLTPQGPFWETTGIFKRAHHCDGSYRSPSGGSGTPIFERR